MNETLYTGTMTAQQSAWFRAEYERARKDEVVGVLLAFFLGGFGIHRFYLRQNGLGVLYILFGWTGVPILLGWIECFFMPGRVREFNALQAAYIAGQISKQVAMPGMAAFPTHPAPVRAGVSGPCLSCGGQLEGSAMFCPHCGATAR